MTETEYHVQEFEEGPGGGWWAMLQTSDLNEAQTYLAQQNSEAAIAQEIADYGFSARRRLVTVTVTPFDEPDHLRNALLQTVEGLMPLIPENTTDKQGPTSLVHLQWMLSEITRKIAVWPTDKTSRWIGFVQGALATKGMLDVNAERARTRPIFHEAYQAMGLTIPETVDRDEAR